MALLEAPTELQDADLCRETEALQCSVSRLWMLHRILQEFLSLSRRSLLRNVAFGHRATSQRLPAVLHESYKCAARFATYTELWHVELWQQRNAELKSRLRELEQDLENSQMNVRLLP